MDELSLLELLTAFACTGLMIDFRKEPEKYGIYSKGLNNSLYAACTVFLCSVLYGLMLWMPGQGVATFVRFATAAIIGIITGFVYKKHNKTFGNDVKLQFGLVTAGCIGCAADVVIAALGI